MKRWSDQIVGNTVVGSLTVPGGLTVLSGPIVLPANNFVVKCWVSNRLTETNIVGGGASEFIAFTGFPAAVEPVAAYLLADEAATSGNANTTALTYSLGISTAVASYLQAGANMLGLTGRSANAAGTLLGTYRAADTVGLGLVATGGAPNTAHITNLAVRAVVYYLESATE